MAKYPRIVVTDTLVSLYFCGIIATAGFFAMAWEDIRAAVYETIADYNKAVRPDILAALVVTGMVVFWPATLVLIAQAARRSTK